MDHNKIETIALGAGCFWCVEGIFSMIKGVTSTQIGYGGGITPDPTYTSVSAQVNGHAELTILEYNPNETSLDYILEVFFAMHNPNKTYNINDKKGQLYRSVILYKNDTQQSRILKFIEEYEIKNKLRIKTEVKEFKNYKMADEKYQNYYQSNPDKPFCKNVIYPKISKLKALGIL